MNMSLVVKIMIFQAWASQLAMAFICLNLDTATIMMRTMTFAFNAN